jgi:GTPase SAR1 family protein
LYSDLDVKVPELIIIGAQSKGKSSIVEAMSLQMFNFTRPDIASRFPIHFRMMYSPAHMQPTWRIIREQKILEENRTTLQVASYIERSNEALQSKRAVDSIPVLLELRWNNCPNLSFVDLPGLRSLATDENEAILQQQIESMARYIVSTKHRSAHATFLVVEEAKDDIANFHGLSKVFEMLSHARHAPEPTSPASATNSSSSSSSNNAGWIGEDEDRCKFVLVLNKLDQFVHNSDGSVEDKRAKIQTIVKKFEPKGIPVFFTSLPTSQMKQVFKSEPTDVRASEAFSAAVREHSERDRLEMERIVPEYVWFVVHQYHYRI